jgi:hypothetical protein
MIKKQVIILLLALVLCIGILSMCIHIEAPLTREIYRESKKE